MWARGRRHVWYIWPTTTKTRTIYFLIPWGSDYDKIVVFIGRVLSVFEDLHGLVVVVIFVVFVLSLSTKGKNTDFRENENHQQL